jgi:hypothetical protein
MRCLLDKVTARYTVEGLSRLTRGQELTRGELSALDLLSQATSQTLRLFIVPPTASVLQSLSQLPLYAAVINLFLDQVEVTVPSHYFKRWARRLRDYGFTREDAAVLALATFSTDANAAILGMHFVATFDQPMINHWASQRAAIQRRLTAMRNDIPMPYRHASLPQVLRPEWIAV